MNRHLNYTPKRRSAVKNTHAKITLRYANRFPSGDEILSMPSEHLEKRITHWMWDSPNDNLPCKQKIMRVIELVKQRPDADLLANLLTECRYYIITLSVLKP